MLTTDANGVDPSSNVVESKSLCAGGTSSDVPARLKHTQQNNSTFRALSKFYCITCFNFQKNESSNSTIYLNKNVNI